MPGGDYATAGADSTASDPRGMWGSPKRGNQNATLTSEQQEAIRRLTALGYVGGSTTPVTDATMTVLDETKAYQAASLYTSGHGPEASLIDMEGNELHSWRFSYRDGWPDPAQPPEQEHFRRVHLYENGDLLLIYSFGIKGVLKLDKDYNCNDKYNVFSMLHDSHVPLYHTRYHARRHTGHPLQRADARTDGG